MRLLVGGAVFSITANNKIQESKDPQRCGVLIPISKDEISKLITNITGNQPNDKEIEAELDIFEEWMVNTLDNHNIDVVNEFSKYLKEKFDQF